MAIAGWPDAAIMDRSTRITEYFNLLDKPNRPNPAEVREAVKVRNELLPGRLYRYRGCTDYAFDNLKNSLLWLAELGPLRFFRRHSGNRKKG